MLFVCWINGGLDNAFQGLPGVVFEEDAAAVITDLGRPLVLVDGRDSPAAPLGGPSGVLEDTAVDSRQLDRYGTSARLH